MSVYFIQIYIIKEILKDNVKGAIRNQCTVLKSKNEHAISSEMKETC